MLDPADKFGTGLGSTTNFIDVYSFFRFWFLFFVRIPRRFWLLAFVFYSLVGCSRASFLLWGNNYFLFLFPVAFILCDITLGGSHMEFFFGGAQILIEVLAFYT